MQHTVQEQTCGDSDGEMQQRNEDFIDIAATKITLCALIKNYLIPNNITNKNREKTTLFKIIQGKSKTIRKYNVLDTMLNYGAIHSAEFKWMCQQVPI